MQWKGQLYVDVTLPFGRCSASMIFNAVAEALAFVIRQKGMEGSDHYLDNFKIVDKLRSPQCKRNLETVLATCEEVCFRVVPENPTTALSLLGVELDTELLVLRLHQKKSLKLRELVEKWRRRKSCSNRSSNHWQAT